MVMDDVVMGQNKEYGHMTVELNKALKTFTWVLQNFVISGFLRS